MITCEEDLARYQALDGMPAIMEYASSLNLLTIWRADVRDNEPYGSQFWGITKRLQHVRALAITRMHFATSDSLTSLPWSALFPYVQDLALIECTFQDASTPLFLAATFPDLRTLKMADIRTLNLPLSSRDEPDHLEHHVPDLRLTRFPRRLAVNSSSGNPAVCMGVLSCLQMAHVPVEGLDSLRITTSFTG